MPGSRNEQSRVASQRSENAGNSPANQTANSRTASKTDQTRAESQRRGEQNPSRGQSRNVGNSPAKQTANSRTASKTDQTRAESQRSEQNPSRGQSRTSRVSGISRTPSAERVLLERLSGTPEVVEDGNNGSTGNASQTSLNVPKSRQSQTGLNQTPGASQKSRATVRETPKESRGKVSRQSRESEATGNEETETARSDEQTTTYYETTANLSTGRVESDVESRRSNRKSNAEASFGGIRVPNSPVNAEENDWRAGKTVADTNTYMLKYEVACDTICIVDDTKDEVKCHRYMLMSRSPALFPLLQTQRNNIRIELPDIKKEIFKDVIQYIYSDMFDVHKDNVTGLLYAAKRLQLRGLRDICFRFLDAELRDDTVTLILERAHEYNEMPLYEKCLRYIYNRGTYVLKEKAVETLCYTCFEKIIKSNDLRADEEVVYEGAMMWANAQCVRKKLPPSDEYRRKMLGEMVFLIRFPILNKTYFTQKISNTDLLTQEEKLSVFQYFHGSDLQILSNFNADERNWSATSKKNFHSGLDAQPNIGEPIKIGRGNDVRSEQLNVVRRFHTSEGSWKQNGPDDAITFLTSVPITLRGIEIFGTALGSEGYKISVIVIDELRRAVVKKTEVSIFTESQSRAYDVQLSAVRIPARQPFTVVVSMKGAPTHKGVCGETTREVDGVHFEFRSSNKSPNGSDVTVGQIPGILFTRSD